MTSQQTPKTAEQPDADPQDDVAGVEQLLSDAYDAPPVPASLSKRLGEEIREAWGIESEAPSGPFVRSANLLKGRVGNLKVLADCHCCCCNVGSRVPLLEWLWKHGLGDGNRSDETPGARPNGEPYWRTVA